MYQEGSFSGSTFFCKDELSSILLTNEHQRLERAKNYVMVFSREKDTRILLTNLPAMWGYASQTTANLENLLTVIKDHPPAMILVDSVIPFDVNLKIIHRIRSIQLNKKMPVAMLSGFSQPECRRLALQAGANDFFVKPLDFDLLESFLQVHFDELFGD